VLDTVAVLVGDHLIAESVRGTMESEPILRNDVILSTLSFGERVPADRAFSILSGEVRIETLSLKRHEITEREYSRERSSLARRARQSASIRSPECE
jgi:hypothetical protein